MTDLTTSMVRTAFGAAAGIRHARVFHPHGLLLTGRFRATPAFTPWFGTGDRAAIARLSKGLGSPAGAPDVLGLAFRVLDRDHRPWDFALATTGRGLLSRLVVTPARGWASARFGSLLPYRFADSAPLWLFADPLDVTELPAVASLPALDTVLDENPLRFDLLADGLSGSSEAVGELDLRRAEPGEHRTDFFDPMLNRPTEVAMVPALVSRIRETAYAGSRHGRGEDG